MTEPFDPIKTLAKLAAVRLAHVVGHLMAGAEADALLVLRHSVVGALMGVARGLQGDEGEALLTGDLVRENLVHATHALRVGPRLAAEDGWRLSPQAALDLGDARTGVCDFGPFDRLREALTGWVNGERARPLEEFLQLVEPIGLAISIERQPGQAAEARRPRAVA